VIYSRLVEAAGESPGFSGRIVEFRAREISTDREAKAAFHKHPAIGEQSRRVLAAIGIEAAGRGPSAGRRVIEFGARDTGERADTSTGHQHLAVGQKGRLMSVSRLVEAAGRGPSADDRVIKFRLC
jgi:hypothetical protein